MGSAHRGLRRRAPACALGVRSAAHERGLLKIVEILQPGRVMERRQFTSVYILHARSRRVCSARTPQGQ